VNLNIGKFANNIGGGSTIKKVSIGAQGANAASAANGDRSKLSAFLRPGQSVNAEKESQPRAAQDAEGDSTAKDEKQKQDKLTNEKPEDAGKTASKITKDFTKLALKNTEDKNPEGDNVSRHPEQSEGSQNGKTSKGDSSPKAQNDSNASSSRHAEETPQAKPQSSLDNKAESNKPNISDIAGQVKDSRHPEEPPKGATSGSNSGLSYNNDSIKNIDTNPGRLSDSNKFPVPQADAVRQNGFDPDGPANFAASQAASGAGSGGAAGMGGANGFGGGPGANQPPVTINNNFNPVNNALQPQMTPPPQNITPPSQNITNPDLGHGNEALPNQNIERTSRDQQKAANEANLDLFN